MSEEDDLREGVEAEMDQTLPPYGTWGEMAMKVEMQGKVLGGLGKQMQKMGEEMARQKEKIDMLSRLARTPSGTRKD